MASTNRPVYLNLLKIKLPISGIISIFHRLTGVLMFIAIPVSLYLLQLTVDGVSSYESVASLMLHPLSRFFILLVTWSFVHHLLTGIRFLLIDLDLFLDKSSIRYSAWTVVGLEFLIMLFIIVGLFL